MRTLAAIIMLSWLPALAGSTSAGSTFDRTQTIIRHFTPQEQQAVRYAYVPFTVPQGTTKVDVRYSYDKANGLNVVDLGLFEPGSLALGTKAFRGWSGGARDAISVGVNEASPGYWPGPLPAGEWHVMLGLYKIAPSGVDVQVTIETSDAPATGPQPRIRTVSSAPLRGGPGWFAGSMHTHTIHSDGALSPAALAAKARDEKLDFLVITDHDTTSQQLEPLDAPGLLVITGEEVTTPGGHFNVWGFGGERAYIDFRILPGDPAVRTVVREARARGALVSINHPISDCLACSWTHEIPPDVNAMEIANGAAPLRQQQMVLWDALLREGRRVTAVGESDWHKGPLPLAMPSVRVWARELSMPAILDAVKNGHVVVMANGSLRPPDLTVTAGGVEARPGDEITTRAGELVKAVVRVPDSGYSGARVDFVWDGEVVDSAKVERGLVVFARFPVQTGYLRVHVVSPEGTLLAVTNPVFVKVAAR